MKNACTNSLKLYICVMNEEITARWDADKKDWVPIKTKTYTKKVTTQPFTMLIHPVHPLLFRLTHIKDMHVLFGLCELCEFNSNKVFIHSSRRKELMDITGQSSQHLANSLRRLREIGIVSGGKGEVIINPQVLWKGSTPSRNAAVVAAAPTPNVLKSIKSDFDNE